MSVLGLENLCFVSVTISDNFVAVLIQRQRAPTVAGVTVLGYELECCSAFL